MLIRTPRLMATAALIISVFANPVSAQDPAAPEPPPGWTGSASAGLSMTSGNSDTSTVNLAYDIKRDTGGDFLFKSTFLFLYGKDEGELNNDRLAFDVRGERRLSERTLLFAQTQYLRDSFKDIDYLVSPTFGVNRIFVKNARTELNADVGIGIMWEQNPGLELDTDGAVSAGQKLTHKLTATTELTEKVAALWTMDDFGDALYTFGVGVATSVTGGIQLKFEVLDTYKTRPPFETVEKNDIATLISVVYKF